MNDVRELEGLVLKYKSMLQREASLFKAHQDFAGGFYQIKVDFSDVTIPIEETANLNRAVARNLDKVCDEAKQNVTKALGDILKFAYERMPQSEGVMIATHPEPDDLDAIFEEQEPPF